MGTNLNYTTHSTRRRSSTDQREWSLSHTDLVDGEVVRTHHTITGKAKRPAVRALRAAWRFAKWLFRAVSRWM